MASPTQPKSAFAALPPRQFAQAAALTGAFLLLSVAMQSAHIALNPALTGFVILLAALAFRLIPLHAVEGGARLIIAQSALFLVPAVVAVARQSHVLKADWAPLLAILVGGTVVSSAATAFAVEVVARRLVQES
jgi:holin-like protein